MNEMGLIEIAAVSGETGPVKLLRFIDKAKRLLKAADAAEQLRRQPDFSAEKLNEAAGADANLV
jgi:hypothetical protein